MSRTTRGPTVWLIPLLLFLAMLLVAGLAFNLANLDTGGEPLPNPPGSRTAPPNFWGVLGPNILTSIVAAAFLVFLAAAVVYAILARKRMMTRPVARPPRWWDTIAMLISFFFLALLLYFWPRVARSAANGTASQDGVQNGTINATTIPTLGGIPLGVLLAVVLVLALAVVSILLNAGARLRLMGPAGASTPRRRRAAAATVAATISELQLGEDVRASILACYQRFCRLLGARGIDEQDPLTPRELEDLALSRLGVSPESAESLTSLFEEARYSVHPLGDADRDRAVESLARIREALGG